MDQILISYIMLVMLVFFVGVGASVLFFFGQVVDNWPSGTGITLSNTNKGLDFLRYILIIGDKFFAAGLILLWVIALLFAYRVDIDPIYTPAAILLLAFAAGGLKLAGIVVYDVLMSIPITHDIFLAYYTTTQTILLNYGQIAGLGGLLVLIGNYSYKIKSALTII